MHRHKRLALATATLALGTGLTLAAPTAQADNAPKTPRSTAADDTARSARAACPAPLHAYEHWRYTGGYKKFCKSDMKLSDNKYNNGRKVNDNLRSVKNLTRSCYWTLWTNYWNRGDHWTFHPWTWSSDLKDTRVKYKTSSLYKSCV
ncbi:hypothetical protein ABT390_05335 [Streptomyces aurantiacus]|uniref:Peptidase inhibitor family I36 n=1 Tax=Streptomyces aurantiacus JA 4570 TaxID=1286094 RepID=S3ZMG5_9ACTN|nr:hypothetical protein [Streptomyces aurantiacus]EPH39540.1 hypothetical protein STRAU_7344 [Streptomyces aurantiacus JA 4570]